MSFSCSFEKDTSCLLTNDYKPTKEIWNIVDGRGLVTDGTLNNGMYVLIPCALLSIIYTTDLQLCSMCIRCWILLYYVASVTN